MNRSMLIILFIVVVAVIAFAFYRSGIGGEMKTSTVKIGNHEFEVEVADTPISRAGGLSGRESLDLDKGMLFVFDSPGRPGFWMKDMNFSIDIIWIIGFQEKAEPQTDKSVFTLTTYYPPGEIDRVLEINAGLVERYGIKPGDKVVFRD
jgi:uncharacterized protein